MLDDAGTIFGFVSFWLVPEQHYGHIHNNGVHPDRAGQGWATFITARYSTTSGGRA